MKLPGRAKKRFQALIEHAPDGIALLGLDGRLRQVTPSTEWILGYTSQEAAGQDPALLSHPDDLPALLELLNDLVQNPGKTVQTEYRFRHSDGSWRWLHSTVSNLTTEPSVNRNRFQLPGCYPSKTGGGTDPAPASKVSALRAIDTAISSSFDMQVSLEVLLGEVPPSWASMPPWSSCSGRKR